MLNNGAAYLPNAGEGTVPLWTGVYAGTVVNNHDPLGVGRLQLHVPQVLGDAVSAWAVPAGTYYAIPVNGTPVSVTFLGGDPSQPLWNGPLDLNPLVESAAGPNVTYSPTEPPNPKVGDIWYPTTGGVQGPPEVWTFNPGTSTYSWVVQPHIAETLTYGAAAAAGSLIMSMAKSATTDLYGNAVLEFLTVYSTAGVPRVATQIGPDNITWYTAPTEAGPWASSAAITVTPQVMNIGVELVSQILVAPSGDTSGVKDFGNINSALISGNAVTLLPGVYYINVPIVMPSQSCLRADNPSWGIPTGNYGAGSLPLQGSIIQASSSFSGNALISMGSAGTTQQGGQRISGITLSGQGLPTGNTVHGIYSIGYVGGVKLKDVTVWGDYHTGTGGLGGNGLYVTDDGTAGHNPDFWQVNNCKFSDCGTWGVQTKGLADSWFTDCESTGNGTGGGWSITDGADTRWSNCRGNSNGGVTGFSINCGGGENLQFANCEANLNGTGWVFSGTGTAQVFLTNSIASGNTVAAVSYSGTNVVRTSGGNFTVWIPLTPQNNWANIGGTSPVLAYRWEDNEIVLIGGITPTLSSALSAGTQVCTIPALAHGPQTINLLNTTTRTAQAQLNCGTGGGVTFFQGIGTVAVNDSCFVHGRVSTDA